MAKKKKLDDLEAELAALEAELAALEGKAGDLAKKPKVAPVKPAAAAAAEANAPEPAADDAPARKSRFGLPKLKKGRPDDAAEPSGDAAEAPAEAPVEAAPKKRFGLPKLKKGDADEKANAAEPDASAAAPGAPATPVKTAPAPELPKGDLTHWRQEGRAWVRAVPEHEAPVVRRILDEDERVVREEPATRADLDEATGVKAERGVGKLLGNASGAAGSAVSKLKTFRFGRGKGGSGE